MNIPKELSIVVDIEPIVKLVCMNFTCRYNLDRIGRAECNLKNIVISSDGLCANYESKKG